MTPTASPELAYFRHSHHLQQLHCPVSEAQSIPSKWRAKQKPSYLSHAPRLYASVVSQCNRIKRSADLLSSCAVRGNVSCYAWSFFKCFLIKFPLISLRYSVNPLCKLDSGRHSSLSQLQKDASSCCTLVNNYSLISEAPTFRGQMKWFGHSDQSICMLNSCKHLESHSIGETFVTQHKKPVAIWCS